MPATRVGMLLVCKTGQIIHAGIQSQSDALALLEGKIAPAVLDFRIVTLIDTCQQLHFDLGVASF